ncbi:MAG: hypothetical protein JWN98_608 [Abditibacteriota bacterium]|nr:hypothetical protein [Abditibacteriota bacterium]
MSKDIAVVGDFINMNSQIPFTIAVIAGLSTASIAPQAIVAAPAKAKTAKVAGARRANSLASSALKRRPGYVIGRCVNQNGQPLSGVRIRVFGTTLAGENANFQTKTDASGRFALRLPKGNFHVGWAHYDAPALSGPAYALPLHPVDGSNDDAPSSAGIVENFVLKISGRISPLKDAASELSYYGGSIRVQGGALATGNLFDGHTYRFPQGAAVELQLVPQGKLADGRVGKTIVRRQKVDVSAQFLDIPIGQYQVTAILIEADGTRTPLRIAVARVGVGTSPTRFTPAPEEFGVQGTIYFPSSGHSIPVLTLPGVSYADVYLQL